MQARHEFRITWQAEPQNRLAIGSELRLPKSLFEMRPGLSDHDKRDLCRSLNEHRRHLLAEDRRELARRMRGEGDSTRRIAEKLGVSDITVRRDLEAATYHRLLLLA